MMPTAQDFADAVETALAAFDRSAKEARERYGITDAAMAVEIVRGTTVSRLWERRREEIRSATTRDALLAATVKGQRSTLTSALYLWATDRIAGPQSSSRLTTQAAKAEQLAKHLTRMGKDDEAARQLARAALLKRKADGEQIEIPQAHTEGAVAKLWAIFGAMADKERSEVIAHCIAQGFKKNTATTQYYHWKKGGRKQGTAGKKSYRNPKGGKRK